MNTHIIDIETGPLPQSEIIGMMPAFDPAEVKCGNLKDPDKIAAKIADAEASHRAQFLDRAALDPLTGQVLAIGILTTRHPPQGAFSLKDGSVEILTGSEPEILDRFWHTVEFGQNNVIGFNICLFDLPFLIRRSWKHGVRISGRVRSGRWWGDGITDLRDVWQMGDRMAKGSLDAISKHLGVGGKTGSGKEFAALFSANKEAAIDYLKNDLILTALVADKLGVR